MLIVPDPAALKIRELNFAFGDLLDDLGNGVLVLSNVLIRPPALQLLENPMRFST